MTDLKTNGGWRPEVKAFADLMEAKLRENDDKPGWKGDNPFDLFQRLEQEATELKLAMRKAYDETYWDNPDYKDDGCWRPQSENKRYVYRFATATERAEYAAKTPSEAADVANFAMMISDVCLALLSALEGEE